MINIKCIISRPNYGLDFYGDRVKYCLIKDTTTRKTEYTLHIDEHKNPAYNVYILALDENDDIVKKANWDSSDDEGYYNCHLQSAPVGFGLEDLLPEIIAFKLAGSIMAGGK